MQYIPFLVCMLACPLGMGLMLWIAMRPDSTHHMMDVLKQAWQLVLHVQEALHRYSRP